MRSVWLALAVALTAGAVTYAHPQDDTGRPTPAAPGTEAAEIEAIFQAALGALGSGRPRDAVRLLRRVLAIDPNLVRVRLELARALFEAEEWEAAQSEFLIVLSGRIPDQVRRNILAFIRAIEARKSFDWTLDVGISFAPGNTRSYDTDIVTLNVFGEPMPFRLEREEEDAKVLATVSGGAEYRVPVGATPRGTPLAAFAAVAGTAEFPNGNPVETETAVATLATGLRWIYPRSTVTGAIRSTIQIEEAEIFETDAGFDLAYSERFSSGTSYFLGASLGLVDNRSSIERDGVEAHLRAGVALRFLGRGSLGALLTTERRFAEESDLSFSVIRLSPFMRYDLGRGIDLRLAIFGEHYRDDETIPPFVEPRVEWEVGGDLRVVKSDLFLFGRFNPYAEIGASRRLSSIDAFGYTEFRFGVGVENAF